VSVYRVLGAVVASPDEKDWDLLLETADPVEATAVVHESEGTFWRRLTEDGAVVLDRV
jgi:hypothetical protein